MVRIIARIVAPLAIAAVAVGIYLIVHDNVATTSSTKTHHHHRHAAKHTRGSSHAAAHPASNKSSFYVVRSGDSLSAIVSRTGISLATITRLNPSLKPPYDLSTGQKLRIRR